MGDDRVLYYPHALSKRRVNPAVFIINTPDRHAIDTSVPIEVECFVKNESGDYVITTATKINFEFRKPEKSTAVMKPYFGIGKVKWNDFADTVNRNREGNDTQLIVAWQAKTLEGKDVIMVQAVRLIFTTTSGDRIRTPLILLAGGKKLKGGAVNPIDAFFNTLVNELYEQFQNEQNVDLIELTETLDVFDLTDINRVRSRNTSRFRHESSNNNYDPLEIFTPKYLTAVPNAPFFVLFKRDPRRPIVDYHIEHCTIDPYNCGFTLKCLSDETKYNTEHLAGANDLFFNGHPVRNVYDNLNRENNEYVIKRFIIDHDVAEHIADTVGISLNLPYNTTFNFTVHVTKDIRKTVVEADMINEHADAIGMDIIVHNDEFSHAVIMPMGIDDEDIDDYEEDQYEDGYTYDEQLAHEHDDLPLISDAELENFMDNMDNMEDITLSNGNDDLFYDDYDSQFQNHGDDTMSFDDGIILPQDNDDNISLASLEELDQTPAPDSPRRITSYDPYGEPLDQYGNPMYDSDDEL